MFSLMVSDVQFDDLQNVVSASISSDMRCIALLRSSARRQDEHHHDVPKDSERDDGQKAPQEEKEEDFSLQIDISRTTTYQATSLPVPLTVHFGRRAERKKKMGDVLDMTWLGADHLIVLCEKGLQVVTFSPYDETDCRTFSGIPSFSPLRSVRRLDNGHWLFEMKNEDLRGIFFRSQKCGVLHVGDPSLGSSRFARDMPEVEEFDPMKHGILLVRPDPTRQAIWLQFDMALCSVSITHIGNGVFYYQVLHRVPLNNNNITDRFDCPQWAFSGRSVLVLDKEFLEIKLWLLQPSTSICIANVPVAATVEKVYCVEDGTIAMLITSDRVITILDVSRHVQAAYKASQSRQIKKVLYDPFKICCGLQLESEDAVETSWGAIESCACAKLALFNAPLQLPGDVEVENAVDGWINEGQVILLTEKDVYSINPMTRDVHACSRLRGPVHHFATSFEELQQFKEIESTVVIPLTRPPISPHVLCMLLTTEGFAFRLIGKAINKETFITNEILFGFFMDALMLCRLNRWSIREVEEKRLLVAMADSPSAVFDALCAVLYKNFHHMVSNSSPLLLLRRNESDLIRSPEKPRDSSSPKADKNGSREKGLEQQDFSLDEEAADDALQLTCVLTNAIVSRYENCPDDVAARRELKGLVAATLCFLTDRILGVLIAAAMERVGEHEKLIRLLRVENVAVATLPFNNDCLKWDAQALMLARVQRAELNENPNYSRAILVSALINGLRDMQSNISLNTALEIRPESFDWGTGRIGAFEDKPDLGMVPLDQYLGNSSFPRVPTAAGTSSSMSAHLVTSKNATNQEFREVCDTLWKHLFEGNVSLAMNSLRSALEQMSAAGLAQMIIYCGSPTTAATSVSISPSAVSLLLLQLLMTRVVYDRMIQEIVHSQDTYETLDSGRESIKHCKRVLFNVLGVKLGSNWWRKLALHTKFDALRQLLHESAPRLFTKAEQKAFQYLRFIHRINAIVYSTRNAVSSRASTPSTAPSTSQGGKRTSPVALASADPTHMVGRSPQMAPSSAAPYQRGPPSHPGQNGKKWTVSFLSQRQFSDEFVERLSRARAQFCGYTSPQGPSANHGSGSSRHHQQQQQQARTGDSPPPSTSGHVSGGQTSATSVSNASILNDHFVFWEESSDDEIDPTEGSAVTVDIAALDDVDGPSFAVGNNAIISTHAPLHLNSEFPFRGHADVAAIWVSAQICQSEQGDRVIFESILHLYRDVGNSCSLPYSSSYTIAHVAEKLLKAKLCGDAEVLLDPAEQEDEKGKDSQRENIGIADESSPPLFPSSQVHPDYRLYVPEHEEQHRFVQSCIAYCGDHVDVAAALWLCDVLATCAQKLFPECFDGNIHWEDHEARQIPAWELLTHLINFGQSLCSVISEVMLERLFDGCFGNLMVEGGARSQDPNVARVLSEVVFKKVQHRLAIEPIGSMPYPMDDLLRIVFSSKTSHGYIAYIADLQDLYDHPVARLMMENHPNCYALKAHAAGKRSKTLLPSPNGQESSAAENVRLFMMYSLLLQWKQTENKKQGDSIDSEIFTDSFQKALDAPLEDNNSVQLSPERLVNLQVELVRCYVARQKDPLTGAAFRRSSDPLLLLAVLRYFNQNVGELAAKHLTDEDRELLFSAVAHTPHRELWEPIWSAFHPSERVPTEFTGFHESDIAAAFISVLTHSPSQGYGEFLQELLHNLQNDALVRPFVHLPSGGVGGSTRSLLEPPSSDSSEDGENESHLNSKETGHVNDEDSLENRYAFPSAADIVSFLHPSVGGEEGRSSAQEWKRWKPIPPVLLGNGDPSFLQQQQQDVHHDEASSPSPSRSATVQGGSPRGGVREASIGQWAGLSFEEDTEWICLLVDGRPFSAIRALATRIEKISSGMSTPSLQSDHRQVVHKIRQVALLQWNDVLSVTSAMSVMEAVDPDEAQRLKIDLAVVAAIGRSQPPPTEELLSLARASPSTNIATAGGSVEGTASSYTEGLSWWHEQLGYLVSHIHNETFTGVDGVSTLRLQFTFESIYPHPASRPLDFMMRTLQSRWNQGDWVTILFEGWYNDLQPGVMKRAFENTPITSPNSGTPPTSTSSVNPGHNVEALPFVHFFTLLEGRDTDLLPLSETIENCAPAAVAAALLATFRSKSNVHLLQETAISKRMPLLALLHHHALNLQLGIIHSSSSQQQDQPSSTLAQRRKGNANAASNQFMDAELRGLQSVSALCGWMQANLCKGATLWEVPNAERNRTKLSMLLEEQKERMDHMMAEASAAAISAPSRHHRSWGALTELGSLAVRVCVLGTPWHISLLIEGLNMFHPQIEKSAGATPTTASASTGGGDSIVSHWQVLHGIIRFFSQLYMRQWTTAASLSKECNWDWMSVFSSQQLQEILFSLVQHACGAQPSQAEFGADIDVASLHKLCMILDRCTPLLTLLNTQASRAIHFLFRECCDAEATELHRFVCHSLLIHPGFRLMWLNLEPGLNFQRLYEKIFAGEIFTEACVPAFREVWSSMYSYAASSNRPPTGPADSERPSQRKHSVKGEQDPGLIIVPDELRSSFAHALSPLSTYSSKDERFFVLSELYEDWELQYKREHSPTQLKKFLIHLVASGVHPEDLTLDVCSLLLEWRQAIEYEAIYEKNRKGSGGVGDGEGENEANLTASFSASDAMVEWDNMDTFLCLLYSLFVESEGSKEMLVRTANYWLPPILARLVWLMDVENASASSSSKKEIKDSSFPPELVEKISPSLHHNLIFAHWLRRNFSCISSVKSTSTMSMGSLSGSTGSVEGMDGLSPPRFRLFNHSKELREVLPRPLFESLHDLEDDRARMKKCLVALEILLRVSSQGQRSGGASSTQVSGLDLALQFIEHNDLCIPSAHSKIEERDAQAASLAETIALGLLQAHVVPILVDQGNRVFSREKGTSLQTFLGAIEQILFRNKEEDRSEDILGYISGTPENVGWLARAKVQVLCTKIQELGGHFAALLITERMLAILEKLRGSLPFSKSTNSRLFLEATALTLVHGYWISLVCYDDIVVGSLLRKIHSIVVAATKDGDFELVRKLAFYISDVTLLKFFVDQLPSAHIAAFTNSSPDFQYESLHESSVRMALITYLEMCCAEENGSAGGGGPGPSPASGGGASNSDNNPAALIEMPALYANFRHFTALGATLQQDADRMLKSFVQQEKAGSFRKSLLDNKQDVLRRQNKQLEEVESMLLSAANFFIQDKMYERCLYCLKQLHIISVQKKISCRELMLFQLTKEQSLQVLCSQEVSPPEVILLAYGYDVTSMEAWANIIFKQVVTLGRKEMWEAFKSSTVSVSTHLSERLRQLIHSSEASLTKDQKPVAAWLSEQLGKSL